MEIKEINAQHYEQVKDLLVELQKFIIQIDKYNLHILSKEYREKYFDYMLKDCKENQGKVFVAIDNEKVVGMISGFIVSYDERDKLDYSCPKKGMIAELIVTKDCRSEGIGAKLLQKMEWYFKKMDCDFCKIDVFAYNEQGKRFYYKNGYEDVVVTVLKKL